MPKVPRLRFLLAAVLLLRGGPTPGGRTRLMGRDEASGRDFGGGQERCLRTRRLSLDMGLSLLWTWYLWMACFKGNPKEYWDPKKNRPISRCHAQLDTYCAKSSEQSKAKQARQSTSWPPPNTMLRQLFLAVSCFAVGLAK